MRVVLDTNVLMSAVFFAGVPGRILTAWIDGAFDLILSLDVLDEYRRVGERLERRFGSVRFRPLLDAIIREAIIVDPAPVDSAACDDPDDLKFLGCAIAGQASCVVTGDRALLRASGYAGIEVLSPRGFARLYLRD